MPRLVRILPRSVAPFPRETLASYFRRLELANGLTTDRTGTSLGIAQGDDPLTLLRALTGRTEASLRFALPELDAPQHRSAPVLDDEPMRHHLACTHCCYRAGIGEHVRRWVVHEDVLCRCHRRWLGSPEEETTDQLDLTGHPEVLDAHRRHRRLIARRGRRTIRDTYLTSARIVWDWQCQGRRLASVTARLDRLREGRSCTYLDPAVHAALYPAAVALTDLLTSPAWQPAPVDTDHPHTRRFLHRVAETVTDGYYPTGGQDPLRRLLHNAASMPQRDAH